MGSDARDWIGAAACSEGPTPATRFADLPRSYRKELLRLTAAAGLSIAFFITVGVLPRVLASRSLASRVALLEPPAARPPSLPETERNERPALRPVAAHIRRQPIAREPI